MSRFSVVTTTHAETSIVMQKRVEGFWWLPFIRAARFWVLWRSRCDFNGRKRLRQSQGPRKICIRRTPSVELGLSRGRIDDDPEMIKRNRGRRVDYRHKAGVWTVTSRIIAIRKHPVVDRAARRRERQVVFERQVVPAEKGEQV